MPWQTRLPEATVRWRSLPREKIVRDSFTIHGGDGRRGGGTIGQRGKVGGSAIMGKASNLCKIASSLTGARDWEQPQIAHQKKSTVVYSDKKYHGVITIKKKASYFNSTAWMTFTDRILIKRNQTPKDNPCMFPSL